MIIFFFFFKRILSLEYEMKWGGGGGGGGLPFLFINSLSEESNGTDRANWGEVWEVVWLSILHQPTQT